MLTHSRPALAARASGRRQVALRRGAAAPLWPRGGASFRLAPKRVPAAAAGSATAATADLAPPPAVRSAAAAEEDHQSAEQRFLAALPSAPPPPPPPPLAPPPAAFAAAVDAGAAKAALAAHAPRLLLLSALAGAYIGMGALLALSVGGGCGGLAAQGSAGLQRLIAGLVGLPTGLTLVLCCGGELVTGNLALCTAAALEGRAAWPQVARAWLIAYAGNALGALAVVALAAGAGLLDPGAPAAAPAAAAAAAKCALPFGAALLRGVLANWLVCLAVWMAVSVRDLPSKFLAALLPVSAFVAMGMEHSVANMFIVPAGLVAQALAAAGGGGVGGASLGGGLLGFVSANLVPVTLGNAVGGAVCVAAAYWAAFGGQQKMAK